MKKLGYLFLVGLPLAALILWTFGVFDAFSLADIPLVIGAVVVSTLAAWMATYQVKAMNRGRQPFHD